jgi:flagellar motor switch protein FliG
MTPAEQTQAPLPALAQPEEDFTEPWSAVKDSVRKDQQEIPAIKKAAIILAAIGPDAAAEFLKGMSEAALTRTAIAISRLDRIDQDLLDTVIAEFILSIGTEEEISGGTQTARRLLAEVLDDATIDRIMFDVEGGDTRKAWKKLNDISISNLVTFIGAEHPQTAAVILSELRADKAAAVLERLDREFAQLTMLRLARTPALSPDVAEMVERVIARDFLSALQKTNRARRPADLIAGMMNNLGAENREKFLDFLEGEKPALHAEVLRTMFTFNDIRHRVEARDVPIIMKEVEEATAVTALKWGRVQGNPTVDFIFQNLSKRLAERLEEEVQTMPEPTQRDGEAAHQALVAKIQEMAKSGAIQLIEDDGPEE